MTKTELIESLHHVELPGEAAVDAYAAKREALARRVTASLAARADLERLIGPDNEAMMANNHKNHGLYMASVMQRFDAAQFVETILWVYRAYRCHGFHLTYWPAQLNAWQDAMAEELSAEEASEFAGIYDWLIIHQADFVALSEAGPTVWEAPPHS